MDDNGLMAQAVADAIGATKRQVQTWTDAGVLKCRPETNRLGRGRQRIYDRDELPIGAIIAAVAKFQFHIGSLINLSNAIRGVTSGTSNMARPKYLGFCHRMLQGKEASYILILEPGGLDPRAEAPAEPKSYISWDLPDYRIRWCSTRSAHEFVDFGEVMLVVPVHAVVRRTS